MKKLIYILSLMILGNHSMAQDKTPTAAVLNIFSNVPGTSPEMAGSLLRIELEKTKIYRVLDKHDIIEMGKEKNIDLTDCYGKNCLSKVGKSIDVDLMYSGSIEYLQNKIVVSLKALDVQKNEYILTTVQEYVKAPYEIQAMLQLTLNKMLDITNDPETFKTLAYYAQPPKTPKTKIANNGPRVGAAFIGGDAQKRLMASETEGGWDAFPVVSQFGYQVEKEYLSAGNFHALVEALFIISGPEQQLFNPRLILMNGFRSSTTGLEFAFGPSFGIDKIGRGYFDGETGNWHLQNEWNVTDSSGWPVPNPNRIVSRLDSRGDVKLSAGWVIGVGKTFNSGHLNIPVNFFGSFSKYGWQTGLSVGFNIQNR